MYRIILDWVPKRGPVSRSRRLKYASTKREATKTAKRVIVGADGRYKTFTVRIEHTRYGRHVSEWIKLDGNITRTK
jgi:hypothetical protein